VICFDSYYRGGRKANRSRIRCRYLGKLLLSPEGGAETGIRGVSDVRASIGQVGELALRRLAVEGTFFVKKP
jgi:hypothetical protein